MKSKYGVLAGALALAALLAVPAEAGGYFTNGVPSAGGTQYPNTIPLTGAETIPADTNLSGGQNPQSEAITTTQLAGFAMTGYGSGGWRNGLVGGDLGTNPWQRGTAASADISNTLTYYADQWWNLGGASSAIDVTKETGAADITAGYAASARFQRKSGNTDTAAICTGQVLTSANSTRFQSKLVEFTLHMLAGANFSGASSQVTITIAYGTGSDQSAATFAGGTWTGQAAVNQVTTISTTWTRYGVVASVPAMATQIGVKICYTPVGTAGTNDWVEFTGAQLDANASAIGWNGVGTSTLNAASLERRPASIETRLAYAYFYRLVEPASTAAIPAMCQAVGATSNICNVFLPETMRATTPTITITTAGTFKVNIAGTPTTIATPTASVCGTNSCAVTAGNTNTAGQAELLSGGGGTGKWDISAEL